MLADEERKVFRETQFEVGREQFGQHVYGRGDSPAPDPMFPRRVFLKPSERRGEQKLSTRFFIVLFGVYAFIYTKY